MDFQNYEDAYYANLPHHGPPIDEMSMPGGPFKSPQAYHTPLEIPELSFYAIGKSIRSHRIAINRSRLQIPYKTYGEWMEYLWKSAISHTVDPVHFWTFRNPWTFTFQLPEFRVPKKKSGAETCKKWRFLWIFDQEEL